MGKGSNTTSTTQNSTYTPTGGPAINTALTAAQNAAATPYQAYGGELTAGINQQQQTGINNLNASANLAQPFYNTAQQMATAAGTPLTAAQIQQYQNPYTQSVVNATQAQFANQNQQQLQSLRGNAASQNALGGDRVGVAEANAINQQNLSQAPVIAGLYNQSYSQGLAAAQQQQQQQGTAAGILGGLGTGAQAAGLSGAGAQIGAGTLQQQTSQADLSAQYQQFLNKQAYPFQTSQFLTQATAGLAPSLGGTTEGQGTQTGPSPSPWSSILGAAGVAASFLPSDERIKENKEVIGRLFDGTDIYRYNYKGDNTTRVGLLAQDVERKNPGAVAENSDGVKMVDHHRATDDAASRQHFAGGGMALPYGGSSGYVPTIGAIGPAQTVQPQLPSMGGGSQQQQPDQTKGMLDSIKGIGKGLKASKMFAPDAGTTFPGYGTMDGTSAPGEGPGYTPPEGFKVGVGETGPSLLPDTPALAADGGAGMAGLGDLFGAGEGLGTFMLFARGGGIKRAAGGVTPYSGAGGYVPAVDDIKASTNPGAVGGQNGVLGGGVGGGEGDLGEDGIPRRPAMVGANDPLWGVNGTLSSDLKPPAVARGGAIRGYDDGGLVPSQDDPSGYDSVAPSPYVSYFDPPAAGGVGVPITLPKSTGFIDPPRPEPIAVPTDSGLAAVTNGVPVGALAQSAGFDAPVQPVDQGPLRAAAHLDTGAPFGQVPSSQGFDAPVAAETVPLPPVRPATATEAVTPEVASNIATPTAGYATNIDRIAAAHRRTESSNNYGALGPVHPKSGDRAYGAYQVMGENVPVWTKQILGKSMTPEQFLRSPEAQDTVYKAKMGEYINKYGMDGALRAWLGRAEKDFTGTSQEKYRQMFYAALGKTPENGESGSEGVGDLPRAAVPAQYRGNSERGSLGDESGEKSWAERNSMSNPFAQKLNPQSDDRSNKDTPSWWPFGKMSDATKQQLMATGFGMMASKSPFLGQAIGEGGLQGISVSQKAADLSRQADLARSTITHQGAQNAKLAVETEAARGNLEAIRRLRDEPDSILSSPAPGAPPAPSSSTVPPSVAAAAPKAGLTTVLPQNVPSGGAPGSDASAQMPASPQAAQAIVNSTAATAANVASVQQTPRGPVGVDSSDKPLVDINSLLTTGHKWIKSGVPAYMTAGEKLLSLHETMLSKGVATNAARQVIPLPGAQETKARGEGLNERAKVDEQLAKDGLTRNPDGTISPIPGFNPAVAATTRAKATAETQAKAEGEGVRFNPDGSVAPVPGFSPVKAAQAGEKTAAEAQAKAQFVFKPVQPQAGGPTYLMSEADIAAGKLPPGVAPIGPGAGSPPGGIMSPGAAAIVEKQPEVFTKRQEAIATDAAAMDQAYRARQVARERLVEIQNILKTYQPGAFAQQKANFIANLRGVGIPAPNFDTADPAQFEAFLKNATKNVFDDVKAMGGRVLVSEIQGLTQANANPSLQPGAARAIVGQGLGLLAYEDKHYEDFKQWYNKNPYAIDVSEFEIPWMKANNPSSFVKSGKDETGVLGEPIPAVNDRTPGRIYILPTGPHEWVPGRGWKRQSNNH